MAIITIEELKSKSQQEVEIVGFEEGEFITLLLRKVTITGLVKSGKIPNQLLTEAVKLFDRQNQKDKKGKNANAANTSQQDINLGDAMGIIDIICDACMVNPTFEDAKDYLSDEQKMEIFEWTQNGVKNLKSFREKQGDS